MKRLSLAGRIWPALPPALVCALVLAGCGGAIRRPRVSLLPLVPGARVVTDVRVCDSGAQPYCALELVVADPRYPSSRQLVLAERHLLHAHKWTAASAQTADELANESPGHKLRVTYATAFGDLKGVDLGWIGRTRQVQQSLAREMFAGKAAMSAQLQAGSE
jgi:hypothetical protein